MVERKRNEQGPLSPAQRKLVCGYVEEIEHTEDQIDSLKLDLKGIYEAAKEHGFDPVALKKVVADRKKEPEQLSLFEQTVDAYRAALSQPDKLPKSLMIDRPFAPPLDA